jgi:hypothetical protein
LNQTAAKDLVKAEQNGATASEPATTTETTDNLDYGGAEGKRRSSHHHLAVLHHDDKLWIEKGRDREESFCCSLLLFGKLLQFPQQKTKNKVHPTLVQN